MMLSYDLEALDASGLLPILTASSMRKADLRAIEEIRIPGFALMEVAGRAGARIAQAMASPADGEVLIFCGPGNNGGDGFVVARLLALSGYRIRVIMSGTPGRGSDAEAHFRLLTRTEHGSVIVESSSDVLSDGLRRPPTLCVDALLGTGITRELDGEVADLVRFINGLRTPVLSVDVPTGLHSDTGEILGDCVRATRTVAIAATKMGQLVADGPAHTGDLHVAEIGIPRDVLDDAVRDAGALAITTEAVRRWLPGRARDAHKYSAGFVLVVAGGPGMAGAAVMATRAAARTGAGYVACATPESVQGIVSTSVPSSTTIGLPEGFGGLDPERAIEAIAEKMEKADALVVGPGLGRSEAAKSFVRALLDRWDGKAVIDADAIIALADVPLDRFPHRSQWLLTPHAGEFKALTGRLPDVSSRLAMARGFADSNDVTLLLKGSPSVVARRGRPTLVATTGHESLATAGTGDVLSGMSGAFLARGLSPAKAGACALHIGGLAAQEFARSADGSGMIATDLIDIVPHVISACIRPS